MPEEAIDAGPDEDTQPDAPEVEAPQADTPDAPTTDWEADDNPYKGRYDNLRSDYDRRNQTHSQYERFIEQLFDPETQAETLKAALGIELEDDQIDEPDPEERWEERFAQIESAIAQQAQAKQLEEINGLEEQLYDQAISELAPDASDEEKALIRQIAERNRDQDDIPDYEAAVKAVNATWDARQSAWKRSKQTGRVPGGGPAARKQFDPTDDKARMEASVAAAQAAIDARRE